MKKVNEMSSFELMKYNIDLVKNLLEKHGYNLKKIIHGQAKTDFTVSKNNENFNIKILGYRYNENSNGNYAFAKKINFDINNFKYLYFVLYIGDVAHILKIPTWVFANPSPNSPFKSRDYVGLKSAPEYGIEMKKKNLAELLQYEEI